MLSGGTAGYLIHRIIVVLNILYVLFSGHSVLHVPADVTGRDVS